MGLLDLLSALFSKPKSATTVGAVSLEVHAAGGIVGVGTTGHVVVLIQEALRYAGAELVVDGEYGPATLIAVEVFQASRDLPNTNGVVDLLTAQELDKVWDENVQLKAPLPSALKSAPWVTDVRACTGIKELPGTANSPVILNWRNDIARAYPDMAGYAAAYNADSIPWCGFGLGAAMCRVKIKPPFGVAATDRFMWADSWSRWGKPLKDPVPGCIMVFTRTGGNHVALLEKLTGNVAYVRGFNQGDMVNVSAHSMSTFKAAVWPPGFDVIAVAGDISNAVAGGTEA